MLSVACSWRFPLLPREEKDESCAGELDERSDEPTSSTFKFKFVEVAWFYSASSSLFKTNGFADRTGTGGGTLVIQSC